MNLVVDTNILISFFRENPIRDLIINARDYNLILFMPDIALQELQDNKRDIIKYGQLKNEEFDDILTLLPHLVTVEKADTVQAFIEEARRICPDRKDIPFFAVALKRNATLWSKEPRLKRQRRITVLSTQEVLQELQNKV